MAKQALLVMDVQRVVVDRYPDPTYLPRLREAIGAARTAGLPIVYVVVGFRPGYPEISAANKTFGALARPTDAARPRSAPAGQVRAPRAQRWPALDDDRATEVHPDVAPEPGDVIVTKRRVSSFSGSDLDMVLRAGDIDHLVLAGISTSGVVLSTLRQAADLDFGLTVLADGCLDADPEVHRVLTEKVFPQQAQVTTAAEWSVATTAAASTNPADRPSASPRGGQ